MIAFAIACVAAAVVVALLSGWVVRRWVGPAFDLTRIADLTALILISTVTPIAGGLVLAVLARLGGSTYSFGEVWLASWTTGTLGVMIGTALVVAWRQYPQGVASPPRWRAIEGLGAIALLFAMAEGIFGGLTPIVMRSPSYLMPLLLVVVFRFGPIGTAVAMAIVNLVALPNTLFARGPLVSLDASSLDRALRAESVGIVATVSFLLLACVVAERRRVAQELAAVVAELQQALAEIKTLRGFIPICAWCHKIRDDAGFWQEIEGYLHARTEAVFSHGMCPACSERAAGGDSGLESRPC